MDIRKSNCALGLTLSYGRYAQRRFFDAINEREQSLDRKLSREEILEEYWRLDDQLLPTLLSSRLGK